MKKKCIITLSFGNGEDMYGAANKVLAYEVSRISNKYNIPVIAQWEVGENILDEVSTHMDCFPIHKDEGKDYIDSHDVLIKAKEKMKEKGYTHAVLIAHQLHLPRVRWLAKKLGIQRIRLPRNEKIARIPYPSDSDQWWTRSALAFCFKEVFVIFHHLLYRWI